jgi:REP element-mobilizing transposase RayT
MTNHVHLIVRSEENNLSAILRDFKKFTSKAIIAELKQEPNPKRRQQFLSVFHWAGKSNSRNEVFQVWQQDNHPMYLDDEQKLRNCLHYLHNNPVKAGLVEKPDHWIFSSASDYCGKRGLMEIEIDF